jgi:hypothetical protein
MTTQEELYARSDALFENLVPSEGMASTVEGEMVRAVSRIGYRYSNDGDYFYCGYGTKTAGPAHAYLVCCCPIKDQLRTIFDKAIGLKDEAYEAVIDEAVEAVVVYVEGRNGETTENRRDMLSCKSLYQNFEDEDGFEDEDAFEDD